MPAMYKNFPSPPKKFLLPDPPKKTFESKESPIEHLKIATINIPNAYLDSMEILVNQGFFPSRSEVVREALKQFLTRETFINENLQKEKFAAIKQKEMDRMIH